MDRDEVLDAAEAADRLGVHITVVLRAMYDRRLQPVPTADGIPGVRAGELEGFELPEGLAPSA